MISYPFRYTTLKWWAPSFISGIPTVVCGYRTDNELVSLIETIDVKALYKRGEVFICIYSLAIVFNYPVY